jgi:hypothetical protein
VTVGGVRHRLVHDSVHAQVAQALNLLGWLDQGRYHKPINLVDKPTHWNVPVRPNTVALDFVGSDHFEAELGSRLTSEVIVSYVDVYAENDSLGAHLSGDIRDWLRGRLQATPGGTFPIYDYRQGATPPVIGFMDIRNVSSLRNAATNAEVWMRHWFRVRCEITDTYATAVASEFPYPAIDLFPEVVLFPGG